MEHIVTSILVHQQGIGNQDEPLSVSPQIPRPPDTRLITPLTQRVLEPRIISKRLATRFAPESSRDF